MPRTVTVAVPSDQTDSLVQRIRGVDGLLSLRLQKGISLQPSGDVITIEVTNRFLHPLMKLLDDHGVGQTPGSSITLSESTGMISSSYAEAIAGDTSEATWEEAETIIGKESNMTASALLVMGISGIVAAVGIATNALHLVIGAMVIAPGFQPIVRFSLGFVSGSIGWRRGLYTTVQGYLALIAGAVVATLLLRAFETPPLGEKGSYLPPGTLLSYWTTITPSSILVTLAGGLAGTLLVITRRSVLTAGVMIVLALVPTAAIIGMAAISGEMALVAKGALRWAIEVGGITLTSLITLVWQRQRIQRRPMRL